MMKIESIETASSGPVFRLTFSKKTSQEIHEKLGRHAAERGGILGSGRDGVIRHFHFDTGAQCTPSSYSPDVAVLNRVIKDWKRTGVRFRGIVHSHPEQFSVLSAADKMYAKEIMKCFKKLKRLALPVVMTEPDSGVYKMNGFVAVRITGTDDLRFEAAEVEVAARDKSGSRKSKRLTRALPAATSASSRFEQTPQILQRAAPVVITYHGRFPSLAKNLFTSLDSRFITSIAHICQTVDVTVEDSEAIARDRAKASQYFERVRNAYDLPRLDGTRVVCIGMGGGVGFVRAGARAGFGELVGIDHDHVSACNVGTQSVDPVKIGMPKVDAVAEEFRLLNPQSAVLAVQSRIEDLSDRDFEALCFNPMRQMEVDRDESGRPNRLSKPRQTILLVLTDSFEAQARGHRLGLHFGLPTICAQEYCEGRGAEITFTVPGVTPACHRCITASRYRAYLSEGYRNQVTSDGAPFVAAEMLNAAIGHILLAVAHHGTNHPQFGQLINRLGKRNLILLRMDPDIDEFLGWPAFARPLKGAADPNAFVMLDSIFLPQGPDYGQSESRPICPDCGGTGDLRACIGTFPNTRIMRRKPLRASFKKSKRTFHSSTGAS